MDMAQENNKFVRVEPGDPTRCQSIGQGGNQCIFQGQRLQDGSYARGCPMHHGATAAAKFKADAKRIYLIEKHRARVDALSDPMVSHNLDDELGIQRMLLENLLNKATDVEMMTMAPQMSKLVCDIKETLIANKKIKSAYGELLDRAAINVLCDHLIGVISKWVAPEHLDSVSQDVAACVAQAVASRLGGAE